MAFDPKRLRKWFALGAVGVSLVVLAFWGYGRVRDQQVVKKAKQAQSALGIEVQQSTEGFSLSKSEGGRTIFTVRASKAVQFKGGSRAELNNVNIVVYGRRANRFDQIYGEKFVYERDSGEVRAEGEVHIDLESDAEGAVRPDQAPPKELKNPIHLKTSGLVFNHHTGIAETDQVIEFRIPQGSGTAKGARYDAQANLLTLKSAIRVRTTGPQPATITAARGELNSEEPRVALLDDVRVERESESFHADKLAIHLRDNNSVERMVATGNVRVAAEGASPLEARAPRAEFELHEQGTFQTAALAGGVAMSAGGRSPMSGGSERLVVEFTGKNVVSRLRAVGHVQLAQRGARGQRTAVTADALELRVADGRRLATGSTQGAAQISVREESGTQRGETVITAGKFDVEFGRDNRLRSLRGAPDARVVSRLEGQPERVSTSRELAVSFGDGGTIASIVQEGEFRYREEGRTAASERARYSLAEGLIVLTGSPRVTDASLEATAGTIRVNRVSGDVSAEGEVKTTYQPPGAAPSGAMFSSGDPIHATAPAMTARRTGRVRYTGGARLWQGASIVQAPSIEFDRERRSVVAEGSAAQPVSTVFVQPDPAGKATPVNVTGRRLTYGDAERRARFEGNVLLRGGDLSLTAERVDAYLRPQGTASGQTSQLERVVAEGEIVIQEGGRQATGTRLVYTAADGRFVLTGSEGKSPSIFDAERGRITGDSLTFYSRDDRVVVGSNESSRTVTQTRVKP